LYKKKQNMKHNQLLFIAFLLAGFSGFSQNITSIRPRLAGDKIVVGYNITGAKFYQEFTVSLYVSRDNGQNWQGPLQEVTGDVGAGIKGGQHTVTWEVMKEMPFTNEEFIFDVRAETIEKELKKKFFVQYAGNLTTPFGIRAGLLGKTGFYIEGRMSPGFTSESSYAYTGDYIDDFNQPGYYEFSGNTQYAAVSALAGVTFQLGWNTFLYAGAGYGTQKYLAEVNEYSYEDDALTGTNWAESTTASHSGVEVGAGFIQKLGPVIISAGATALNFEVFNFTAGVGVAF
jgi:hypothetical protein